MAQAKEGGKGTPSRANIGTEKTFGLDKLGLKNIGTVYRNLPIAELNEMAVARGEGYLATNGALVVHTGKFSGRSPKDKFTVDQGPFQREDMVGTHQPENIDRKLGQHFPENSQLCPEARPFHFRRFCRKRPALQAPRARYFRTGVALDVLPDPPCAPQTR